ncbi:hypothetical protein EHS13_17655 [Paenibacillus psychroresistens]|uniref:Ricin B lectin domain-containing protein n=1 Tax=Paenibacillus psychroresistens TaxID=1778678 RepID=A0A6B8RM03_9BACL|nr:glycoside hydrolase [Paenibacillus psychroresistens]QGQ96573.1 hypothetical protein EHS13_17655 [Paenibacillus psychroresistens]
MIKLMKKLGVIAVIAIVLVQLTAIQPREAHASTAVIINPALEHQKWEGWGVSLAWWANVIGQWNNANRNAIIDLAFGDPSTSLGLNIARYNIGAGEDPNRDHMLIGAEMPSFLNPAGVWNWNADAGQRYVLERALQRGVTITEAFANSPPYWMTLNGDSGGAGTTTNLQASQYDNYANYLTEVVKHFKDSWGTTFNYLSIFNEPDSSWWGCYQGGCGVQEGSFWSRPDQETIINKVSTSLASKSLSTQITASEGSILGDTIYDLNYYNSTTKSQISKINTHTYGGSDSERTTLYNLSKTLDKKLWMDEVCVFPGPHDATHTEFNSSMELTDKMFSDLKILKPSAWIEWLLVEGEEQASNVGNVNLIHAPYANNPNGNYYVTKQYYTYGQFTKFIRPGYQFIDADNSNVIASWDKASGKMAIVVKNTATSDTDYTLNLSGFNQVGSAAAVYRTSSTENNVQLANASITSKQLNVQAKARSVTTYVISGLSYSPPSTADFLDNWNNGATTGWTSLAGSWSNTGASLQGIAPANSDAFFMRNSQGNNFTYEGDIRVTTTGGAGTLLFRSNINATMSYAVTIDTGSNYIKLFKFPYQSLATYSIPLSLNTDYHLKVVASGTNFKVYLNNGTSPIIDTNDSSYASGYFGLGTYNGTARFDNVGATAATGTGWNPSTNYKITNRNSGIVLDVSGQSTSNGGNVIQWTDNGGANQRWNLIDAGGGYYTIVNVNSQKLLEISGSSLTDGGDAIQWSSTSGTNQQWQIVDAGGGYYKLINRNSGKALDVSGSSTAAGGDAVQWTQGSSTSQQWSIIP